MPKPKRERDFAERVAACKNAHEVEALLLDACERLTTALENNGGLDQAEQDAADDIVEAYGRYRRFVPKVGS